MKGETGKLRAKREKENKKGRGIGKRRHTKAGPVNSFGSTALPGRERYSVSAKGWAIDCAYSTAAGS